MTTSSTPKPPAAHQLLRQHQLLRRLLHLHLRRLRDPSQLRALAQPRHHARNLSHMKKKRIAQSALFRLSVSICFVLVCAVVISVHANVITVTNTNDSGSGSLRQALADANDGDTITFAVTGIIGLTSGELVINRNITISGPGANHLAISRAANAAPFRIFHVMLGHAVIIEGLTIS